MNSDPNKKKKKPPILESLEADKYDETLDQTTALLQSHANTDMAFRIGTKILSHIGQLQDNKKLREAIKLFKTWFEFCLAFEQSGMSKTTITYYGVMYSKNLLAEKIYEPALEVIELVQATYLFKSEVDADPDFEKYVKFIGTLVYNESLKKELIAKNIELASKLYIQGQQFYIKLETSSYSLLDSLRSYSQYFIKANSCETFFRDLFAMLNKLAKSCEAKKSSDSKRSYLAHFQLCTIIHLTSISYLYGFDWPKSMISSEIIQLRDLVSVGSQPVIVRALDLVELIVSYVNQYQKQSTPRQTPKSSQTTVQHTIVQVLRENAVLERRLLDSLTAFHDLSMTDQSYFQLHLLSQIIDMLTQGLYRHINNSSAYAKCIQDSFLEFFSALCSVHAETTKTIFKLASESSKVAKFVDRPVILFLTWERILEHSLKMNNQTITQHSELIISLCEKTVIGHRDFLAWIEDNKLLSQEDMEKNYQSLESQIIKYCSLIYSEEALANYVRFQKLSLEISIARLRFLYTSDQAKISEVSLLKNFHSISENLLLSLRLKDMFEEALQTIKKVFEFVSSFGLELAELEWIVTNWCKIKRDLWKAQMSTYAKVAITDFLPIAKTHSFTYLIEEIHTYNSFRTVDVSVSMVDEIYHVLERLDSMKQQSKLNKSRIILEIAQFTLSTRYLKNARFQLPTDEYLEQARRHLDEHKCGIELSQELEKDLECLTLDEDNKENNEVIIIEEQSTAKQSTTAKRTTTTTTTTARSRKTPGTKLQSVKHVKPTPATTTKSSRPPPVSSCSCASSNIVNFQIRLLKMLNDYSSHRTATYKALLNLIQARMKIKEKNSSIQTNADNLFLESASNQQSICPEICTDTQLRMSNDELIKQMNEGLALVEQLASNQSLLKDFLGLHSMFRKQLYECVELLAQVYGFFGLLVLRVRVLRLKFTLMYADFTENPTDINYEQLFTSTIINLLKAYLSASMLDEYLAFKNELAAIANKQQETSRATSGELCDDSDSSFIQNCKIFSKKAESLVPFYLTTAHYYIMRHRHEEALSLIQNKVLTSSIVNGKPTSVYFEIKYYLRSLQFMLSMSSLNSKCQLMLKAQIEEETPLSLLEESSSAAFSVARYYLKSSIEPARVLSVAALKPPDAAEKTDSDVQAVFFDIGNAESYRILSETLDILQQLCRYYIEISRYRDAIAYIKESLEISQLHLSTRRVVHFLYEQIYADIIASAFSEATSRLKIADQLNQLGETIDWTDIYGIKGLVLNHYLKAFKAIKSDTEIADVDSFFKTQAQEPLMITMAKQKLARNFCKDTILKYYFMMAEHAMVNKKKKEMVAYLKPVKELLFKSHETTPCAIYENWLAAEYYCIFYEIEQNASYLSQAYELVKANPHPMLYKRICVHKSNAETNDNRKLFYLFETQSIALRHKACAIQLKHKRKSTIHPEIYEKTMAHVSFTGHNLQSDLVGLIQRMLPANCVIVSMVLLNSTDLWITRIEADNDPLVFKLAYDPKFSAQFKTILSENDQSMRTQDRSKFWNSRSQLNIKLANFLQDLETNVFSFARVLMLGSIIDFDINKAIKTFCAKFELKKLTRAQEKSLRLVYIGLDQLSASEMGAALNAGGFEPANIDALVKYLCDDAAAAIKLTPASIMRRHVCVLIDKQLHQLPWECLPVTKKQSISRMPSIHFLLSHLQINCFNIDKDKAFYIVDPGGDLQYTKQKFQSIFDKKTKWDGIIGVPPNETVFKRALTEYELFIYTGHGSGSQYYPSDDVQRLKVQACSILMGCSSGNQYTMGDFEPYGTILAYILAGCPCIVGNLWDVTDRDIDRFTEEFLESWLNDNCDMATSSASAALQGSSLSMRNICIHLIKARDSCRMAYLNGSAPIVYGLPVSFKPSNSGSPSEKQPTRRTTDSI